MAKTIASVFLKHTMVPMVLIILVHAVELVPLPYELNTLGPPGPQEY